MSNPLFFNGCSSIQIFIHSLFSNTVSEATLGTLPFTVQHLYHLWDAMPCHWLPVLPTQPLPREIEGFSRRA